ncbi:hypothetical protein PENSTE_c002G02753 [Penicillium steckii]|uniref:Arrestin-like N-terminal domain-containing protein n=1 Tax=Penicillium steckii TaxID=303698 RepID=A0A1V6TTS4_9EURO|nr:hypothetical protein PENSTE_c002G02753 [Penicillium steckii]
MAATATILLDSQHKHYTNLDFLSGKVVLSLPTEAAIGGIQVKLEGESRTRLSGPRNPHNVNSDKKRNESEVHKILYKVATVFPTAAVMQTGSPATSYTFAPGSYEYPFQFKFPFNNACSTHNSMLTNLNFNGLKVEMARDTNRHVKKTLPPSLSGFPGMADIKYFVKATVIRPQFYKENIRAIVPLNFLPIEPPRLGNPNEETYARRPHQFSKPPNNKKKGIFSRGSLKDANTEPPKVTLDARLPNPSILTCNEPVPLRLILRKLTDSPDRIFLQMLQIELISFTKILAHDLAREEIGSWVIVSRSNMNMALGRQGDATGTDWAIDPSLWNNLPLPNSVAPSFETCNIERRYELEIRIGLMHGTPGDMKPQLIVLPLRMPVKVYSGIAPPQALLDAMAAAKLQPSPTKPQSRPSWPTQSTDSPRPPMPPRPSDGTIPAAATTIYDDAPPSYEDAMADNIAPVDGPRREYHPPDASTSRRTVEPGTDAKSPVQTGKDREAGPAAEGFVVPGSREGRSSSESFDMLPTTPPESHSGSPPTSPVRRSQSTVKVTRNPVDEESPPQYQPVAEGQQGSLALGMGQRQMSSSQNHPRPMNLGVPSRKPVPRSSERPH